MVCILSRWIGTDNDREKLRAFGRLINKLIGLKPCHGTVIGKQWPHHPLIVLAGAVLDVADSVFCFRVAHFAPFDKTGHDNRRQDWAVTALSSPVASSCLEASCSSVERHHASNRFFSCGDFVFLRMFVRAM